MDEKKRQFLIVDKGTPPSRGADGHLYSLYEGTPRQEDALREWTNEEWCTPLDAPLDVIARDMRQGGWLLYEGIWPADAEKKEDSDPGAD